MKIKAESLVLLQIVINGKCLIWPVFMWMKQQPNTKALYLIISPYLSDEFKMRIEAMSAHIQAEYDVLLRSKFTAKTIFPTPFREAILTY